MTLEHFSITLEKFAQHEEHQLHHRYRRGSMIFKLAENEGENALLQLKGVLKVKSQPYDFGKFFIQNKLAPPQFTNNSPIQRCRTEVYNKYEKMIDYSRKKLDSKTVSKLGQGSWRRKKCSVNCLKSIVDREKTKMLTEINRASIDKRVVENMMKDDSSRSQLISEVILMDRWIDLEKDKLERRPIKKRTRHDLNPQIKAKHLHLQQFHTDEQAFCRRVFVRKCRQGSFHEFPSQKLKRREAGSKIVMKTIMSEYCEQIESKNEIGAKKVMLLIGKLFLKYANDTGDQEQWFTFIDREGFSKFCKDFKIEATQALEMLECDANDLKLSRLLFYQVVYQSFKKDKNGFLDIYDYLSQRFVSQKQLYLPRECFLFEENKQFISNLFRSRRVQLRLTSIVADILKIKGDGQMRRITFDELVQVFWRLKVYPFLATKKRLKFFYLYSQSHKDGLSLNEVADVLMFISLQAQKNIRRAIVKMVNAVCSFGLNDQQ